MTRTSTQEILSSLQCNLSLTLSSTFLSTLTRDTAVLFFQSTLVPITLTLTTLSLGSHSCLPNQVKFILPQSSGFSSSIMVVLGSSDSMCDSVWVHSSLTSKELLHLKVPLLGSKSICWLTENCIAVLDTHLQVQIWQFQPDLTGQMLKEMSLHFPVPTSLSQPLLYSHTGAEIVLYTPSILCIANPSSGEQMCKLQTQGTLPTLVSSNFILQHAAHSLTVLPPSTQLKALPAVVFRFNFPGFDITCVTLQQAFFALGSFQGEIALLQYTQNRAPKPWSDWKV